jgi:hypothetical protein
MITTSSSFIDYLIALQTRHSDLRIGQHMFNTLATHNPRLVEDIREQSDVLDPFYNDSKVPVFLNYIIDNWNKYDSNNINT